MAASTGKKAGRCQKVYRVKAGSLLCRMRRGTEYGRKRAVCLLWIVVLTVFLSAAVSAETVPEENPPRKEIGINVKTAETAAVDSERKTATGEDEAKQEEVTEKNAEEILEENMTEKNTGESSHESVTEEETDESSFETMTEDRSAELTQEQRQSLVLRLRKIRTTEESGGEENGEDEDGNSTSGDNKSGAEVETADKPLLKALPATSLLQHRYGRFTVDAQIQANMVDRIQRPGVYNGSNLLYAGNTLYTYGIGTSGETVFCVEPVAPSSSGSYTLNQYNELIGLLEKDVNSDILTAMERLMGLGAVYDASGVDYTDVQTMVQVMLWELLSVTSTGSGWVCDRMEQSVYGDLLPIGVLNASHALYDHLRKGDSVFTPQTLHEQLRQQLFYYDTIPSFMHETRSEALANPFSLCWNEEMKRYETQIIDENGILSPDNGYGGLAGLTEEKGTLTAEGTSIHWERDGNSILFFAEEAIESSEEVQVFQKLHTARGSKNTLSWYSASGTDSGGSFYQTMAVGGNARPKKAYLAFQTEGGEKGSLHIVKLSSDSGQRLKNAAFQLERMEETKESDVWTVVEEKKSDSNGELWFEDLIAGKYRVTETQAPTGYQLLSRAVEFTIPYQAEPDGESEVMAGATPYEAELIIGNSLSFVLPETGGRGDAGVGRGITVALLLTMGMCLVGWIVRKQYAVVGQEGKENE